MILTFLMVVVVFIIIVIFAISSFNVTHRTYQNKNIEFKKNIMNQERQLISEDDLQHLPDLVKDYLHFVGVVGTEKVLSYQVIFDGEFKMDRTKEFASVKIEQTSYINPTIRLFYMSMKYNKLKLVGLHDFEEGKASMKIKILDAFTIINASGENMNQAETVTIFNDMCLFAPGSIIDERITWEEIDLSSVKGTFINEGITVSAILSFDDEGKLVNFISNDRFYSNTDNQMLSIPWSTPIYEYQEINGMNLVKTGEAIWHFDDEDYVYIKLNILDVQINPGE